MNHLILIILYTSHTIKKTKEIIKLAFKEKDSMTIALIILIIVLAIFGFLFITSIIAYKEVIDKYTKEVAKNEELSEINKNLRQQLDCHEQIIKVEQVIIQPIDLHCQLHFDLNISDDMKKRLLYRGLGDELTRELEKRSNLCKISTEVNYKGMCQRVDAEIRILPYMDLIERKL